MNESDGIIEYKDKLLAEITKRQCVKAESMSLGELLIEYNILKSDNPMLSDTSISDPSEPIITKVITIVEEPKNYKQTQLNAVVGLVFGLIGTILALMMALGLL